MPRATKQPPVPETSSLVKMLSRYESEISSILGMLVVAALAVFIFLFIKKFMPKPSISPVAESTQTEDLLKVNSTPIPTTYTVKNGQGLAQVAKDVYGDSKKWKVIADANNIKPPYVLRAGQTLNLPEQTSTAQATPEATVAPETSIAPAATPVAVAAPATAPKLATETRTPDSDSYTIAKGDSLWKIAEAQYGTGYAWVKIYRANKQAIGKNPGLIHAGNTLVLPRE